jgi:hypothetical protein
MTAQGPRKGEPSQRFMRNVLRRQPAHLVRGSSRRIMTMRFRPANIRVINRRVCSSAVIGPAVQNRCSKCVGETEGQGERNLRFLSPLESPFFPRPCSELTSGNVFPPSRPSMQRWMPERCSASRVRFAAPNTGAPLTPPRRSADIDHRDGRLRREHSTPAPNKKAGMPPSRGHTGLSLKPVSPAGG